MRKVLLQKCEDTGWEGKSGRSQRLEMNSFNVSCSNATCSSVLKCYHKQKNSCHLDCMCNDHEHDVTSLHSTFPQRPIPKPSNAGDWDTLHTREAPNNPGSSSGCYWKKSVENCFIKGSCYKSADQKSKHNSHHREITGECKLQIAWSLAWWVQEMHSWVVQLDRWIQG